MGRENIQKIAKQDEEADVDIAPVAAPESKGSLNIFHKTQAFKASDVMPSTNIQGGGIANMFEDAEAIEEGFRKKKRQRGKKNKKGNNLDNAAGGEAAAVEGVEGAMGAGQANGGKDAWKKPGTFADNNKPVVNKKPMGNNKGGKAPFVSKLGQQIAEAKAEDLRRKANKKFNSSDESMDSI